MFCQLCVKIQSSLIEGMIDAPTTHRENNMALDRQRKAKREKENIAERNSLVKAQKKLIHAIYRFEMYKSEACIKGELFIVSACINVMV